jgi:D-amino-acid dehydrogenase
MTAAAGDAPHAIVIGAGIIGVCCALQLQREGWTVTLIDRQEPGEGASYGNGGVLTCEAVVPVQTPGIQRRVPGMLLDPPWPADGSLELSAAPAAVAEALRGG